MFSFNTKIFANYHSRLVFIMPRPRQVPGTEQVIVLRKPSGVVTIPFFLTLLKNLI